MDAAPLIAVEVEYTFEDYREAYIAQQRSLRPPMSWKSIIAWIVFLLLFVLFLYILHLGSNAPDPPTPTPPPAPPPPIGTLNLILRIALPLVPWMLILFIFWFFIARTLRTRRPYRPVEQYIRARSLPNRGYFLWTVVLLGAVYLVPTLSKSGAGNSESVIDLLPFGVIFVILWFVIFRGLQKMQIRRLWIGQPQLQLRTRFSLDNAGLVAEDSISRTSTKWEGIRRFIETQNLFLLMRSDYSFYIFPKRLLPDGGSDLRALLREKIHNRTQAFPVTASPPPLPPMDQR